MTDCPDKRHIHHSTFILDNPFLESLVIFQGLVVFQGKVRNIYVAFNKRLFIVIWQYIGTGRGHAQMLKRYLGRRELSPFIRRQYIGSDRGQR